MFNILWPKKLSKPTLASAKRVEKSLKIIKGTCSSIRDLRVRIFQTGVKSDDQLLIIY